MNPLALVQLRLLARLPLPLLHGMGNLLGWLSWLVPNPNKTVTQRNLELCFPDLMPAARRTLARRTLTETGKALLETPLLWLAPGERVLGWCARCVGWSWSSRAWPAARA